MGGSGGLITKVVGAGLMVAGLFTGGTTTALGIALMSAGVAVQVAGSLIFKPKIPSMDYRDTSERKQMLRSPSASETVIIGKTIASGLLFFAEEEEGEQDENEKITLALALAGHPIDRIGKIWLGDDLVGTFGDKASWELHNDRKDADPFMLENCPSWEKDMIGRGMAWLRVTLTFDQEKFPYGLPNVKCEIWGKKLFDPRTGETEWSNNGALVILDYYRDYLKVPDSDIDFESFKQAADLCDESVSNADGDSELRYTLNGAYDLNESPSSVLEAMHKCINAEPTFTAGKHGIQVGAYYGPALKTITESQLIDTVTCTPETGLKDATNAVYGTFIDAEQLYTKTDFTPVIVNEWIEEDGLEIRENVDYRFVTSPYQAQRLARQYLRKKKAGRRVQLTMNLDGYAYRPGEVVILDLPSLNISGLEFRIAEWTFHALDGVSLTLEEDGAYLYEDVIGKPFVRPPFTKLPTGGVPAPINLAFVPLSVTDIVQGYISWQNVASDIRYNTVNILQNGKVIQSIQVPGERVDINGLTRGTYRVEVRAINVAGAMSAPAISDFAIQAPPAPIGVEITPGMFSLTAYPKQGDSAVFGYTFEFWFSEKKLANLSENEVITKTNKVGQGNFWTQENLKAGHTYYFYIRTINSYGKSVFVEASGVPVSLPTDIFDDLDNTVRETEAFKQLSEELKWNTESIAVLTNATYSLSTDVLQRSANAQAGITQLQQLRVSDNEAWAQEIKEIYSAVGENKSAIRETQTSITELNKAFGQTTTEIRTELKTTNDATNKRIDDTNQKLGNTDKEIGRIRADVATNKEAISETNKAMAKSEEQVQAQFGKQQGMINQKMQAEFSQTGDGVVTHSINITIVHNNVKYNAAGQVISAQVKNGKLESFIGYNANNFAWYNPVNGKMELFMYAKNGQFFIRDLFIEDGSITNAKIGNVIQSNNYLNGRPSWIINKNGFAEFQNIKARGEIEATSGRLKNVVIEESCDILGKLKVENLEGNIVTVTQDVYHNLSFSHNNIVELFKVKRRTQKCFIWVQGALNPYERIPNNGVKPENRSAFAYRAPFYRNGAGAADIYIDGVIQPRPSIYNMKDTSTSDFYAVNEFVLELSPGEGVASIGIKIPQGGSETTRFIMRARIIVFPDNQDVIFN
ncbi:phage tail tip fiber protein [Proteus mirabilis]|uniref:phage tail tip fiber protein n=2 Tax=Proteus mirabilis TaxID=584 RepID=UPI00391A5216